MEISPQTEIELQDTKLSSPAENLGLGLFSKLILFGMVVGVVAIYLKSRKSQTIMTEKSLA